MVIRRPPSCGEAEGEGEHWRENLVNAMLWLCTVQHRRATLTPRWVALGASLGLLRTLGRFYRSLSIHTAEDLAQWV
eukprot:2881193-Lingulodinium_polyedra.AAC.1